MIECVDEDSVRSEASLTRDRADGSSDRATAEEGLVYALLVLW
jgi:hypothetical protein